MYYIQLIASGWPWSELDLEAFHIACNYCVQQTLPDDISQSSFHHHFNWYLHLFILHIKAYNRWSSIVSLILFMTIHLVATSSAAFKTFSKSFAARDIFKEPLSESSIGFLWRSWLRKAFKISRFVFRFVNHAAVGVSEFFTSQSHHLGLFYEWSHWGRPSQFGHTAACQEFLSGLIDWAEMELEVLTCRWSTTMLPVTVELGFIGQTMRVAQLKIFWQSRHFTALRL